MKKKEVFVVIWGGQRRQNKEGNHIKGRIKNTEPLYSTV